MTTYAPNSIYDFSAKGVTYAGTGVSFVAPPNLTTNYDFLCTQDMFVTGGALVVSGQSWGDSVSLSVVDKTGFTGYPAGTVLNVFVNGWNIVTDTQQQTPISVCYPAKVISGLYIRVAYLNTSLTATVKVGINFDFHLLRF